METWIRDQALPLWQKVGFDPEFGANYERLLPDGQPDLEATLNKLVEPFRKSDREEALQCLMSQGGLDACYLSFFTDNDIGNDKVWDNWRLEGPSFVFLVTTVFKAWYLRSF